MAAITQLSLTATPGRRYSFSAKDPAPIVSGPHTGLFTELSVIGLPGQRHSFTAKTPSGEVTGPHIGLFTALSVSALPGMRRVFVAKAEAEAIIPVPTQAFLGGGGGGGSYRPINEYLIFAKEEDEMMLTALLAILPVMLEDEWQN